MSDSNVVRDYLKNIPAKKVNKHPLKKKGKVKLDEKNADWHKGWKGTPKGVK
jgi:hypothetical protein